MIVFISIRVDGAGRIRGDRSENIKRLMAYSSIAAYGIRAGRACGRQLHLFGIIPLAAAAADALTG
jgi:NADH:ubiquinone oxidoreductase subunit 2 (subunit N)